MKIYSKKTVYEAAIERINLIFDEFPIIIVGFSGGKDSTVTLNLALQVAQERGRLPLKVLFLDQEAEWQTVIDYVGTVMYDKRVDPIWLQIPIKLFNSTSTIDSWLHCWGKGEEWMRPKDPISLKENIYGTDRFAEMFTRYMEVTYPGQKACYLAGVRTEESPTRFVGLTSFSTYKHITWGKVLNKKMDQYTFYPLYDWSYTDIWKAIHDNHWPYCSIYDSMYQHGVKILNMRVSNVHHETAVRSLYYLQEIEGETWERLTRRISGINTAGQMKTDAFEIKELPYMFTSWQEYRDYLLQNLITDVEVIKTFEHKFELMQKKYGEMGNLDTLYRVQIGAILTNDYHMTKIVNWEKRPEVDTWRKAQRGIFTKHTENNKYLKK